MSGVDELSEFIHGLLASPIRLRRLHREAPGYRRTCRSRWEEFLLLPEGLSLAEAARRLGCDKRQVTRYRARAGIAGPAPAPHRPEDRELAARLLEDGCPIAEVARTVNANHTTIRRWIPDAPAWTPQQSGALRRALGGFELHDSRERQQRRSA